MDLSRLREIVHGAGPWPRARELTCVPECAAASAPVDADALSALPGARPCETRHGVCVVVRRTHEPSSAHGSHVLGESASALREARAALPLLDGGRGHEGTGPLLFLDLETTGLSGGAGTLAFLVGCAYFDEDDCFQVEQYLLPGFEAERALLEAVASMADLAAGLVTFNGRSFDLPVLETRWLFHRLPFPFEALSHLDMLPPARRLWRAPTGGRQTAAPESACSLVSLERRVISVHRVGDVHGAAIPASYFQFVRSGEPDALVPVLEHNRLDLLSLAVLTARACRLAQDGPRCATNATEALALARLYERAGRPGEAGEAFARAVELGSICRTDPAVLAGALCGLARRRRRERRWNEAAALWRRLLEVDELSPVLRREALTALAVHHEHRARDFKEARRLTLQGLEEAAPFREQEVRHRLARLDRRLSRRNGTPLLEPE